MSRRWGGTSVSCCLGRAVDPDEAGQVSLIRAFESMDSGARVPGFESRPHRLLAVGHILFVAGSSSIK